MFNIVFHQENANLKCFKILPHSYKYNQENKCEQMLVSVCWMWKTVSGSEHCFYFSLEKVWNFALKSIARNKLHTSYISARYINNGPFVTIPHRFMHIHIIFFHTKIERHLGCHHRYMDKENVVIIHSRNLLNVKTNEIVLFSEKNGHIGKNKINQMQIEQLFF